MFAEPSLRHLLTPSLKLTDEQVAQLAELKEATTQIYNPNREEDVPAHAHPATLKK